MKKNSRVPGFKHKPQKLEELVKKLEKVTGEVYTRSQLIKQGYAEAYRSMTKRTGDMVVYYREEDDRVKISGLENGSIVYISTSLETCMKRDPKGLYKKAMAGEIKQFTGISAPYEVPKDPDLVISTASTTPDEASEQLFTFIKSKAFVQ